MFIIIGGDGKEYGPVTADQVRAWIAAGRANHETRAKQVGSEEWRRLADFAEFGPPFGLGAASGGTAVDTTLAERGTRFVARLIDWVIEFACAIPGALILGEEFLKVIMAASQGKEPDLQDLDAQRLALGALVLLGAWLLLLIIQVWMLTTRGQSIGKRIMRIRVVRRDGSNAGILHAWVLRELLITVIGIVISLLPIVGPILLRPAFHLVDWCFIFRDDQRCLHDLIAETKVVKVAVAS